MKAFTVIIASFVLWAGIATAQNTSVTATVAGTAGPWLFVNGGLNTGYQYEYPGFTLSTGPTVVSTNAGFRFTAGDQLAITYVSGLVSAGPGTWPYTDGLGSTNEPNSDANGYGHVPSLYMNPALGPYHIGELVGTFADSSGQIVGTPFAIGDGGDFTIPIGATQLQLGVNDTIHYDNWGSWIVAVGPESVPEPTTTVLVLVGIAGLGLAIRRSRRIGVR